MDLFVSPCLGLTSILTISATVTKDLKFVKHKIAKPFNSILGEHFKCHWEVQPSTLSAEGVPVVHSHFDLDPSPEVLAAAGKPPSKLVSINPTSNSLLPPTTNSTISVNRTDTDSAEEKGKTRVVFLNEQTSHHPPISFFQIEARGPKGTVKAVGADQLSAKFTGTTVKVYPGPHNFGIFITLPEREEEYQISHPTATIAGLLRGSPYVTIGEQCFITCRAKNKRNLRAIISYSEESWLLKPKFLCEGVIYDYGEEGDEAEYTKAKHVPAEKILATFSGNWRGEITYSLPPSATSKTLIDLTPLAIIPKSVAPLEVQAESETQKVWAEVTKALLNKDWSNATKAKQVVEQTQRNKAEERKKNEVTFLPTYFLPEPIELEEWDGKPQLTPAGLEAIEKEFMAIYS